MAVTDCIRTCRHCGAEFQRTAKGQPTAYCSTDCKRAEYAKRYPSKRDKVRAPHRPKLVVCAYCHREAYRRVRGGKSDSGRFCSRECAFQHIGHIAREREALRKIAGHWQWRPSPIVVAETQALRRIGAYKERLTRRPCAGGCGRMVLGLLEWSRTCADCKREARWKWSHGESGRRVKRVARARRRALTRGVGADQIDPIAVFERDGWRCHLCGKKTDPKLRGLPKPLAPELDHVVPLAAGGSHTWGNVKCSCRKCNGSKGATPLGQLGLGLPPPGSKVQTLPLGHRPPTLPCPKPQDLPIRGTFP